MNKAPDDETKAWCACGDSIGPGSVGALCADCALGLERKRDEALARVGQLETLLDGMGEKLGVRTITGLINMLQKADARIVELEAERDAYAGERPLAEWFAKTAAIRDELCSEPGTDVIDRAAFLIAKARAQRDTAVAMIDRRDARIDGHLNRIAQLEAEGVANARLREAFEDLTAGNDADDDRACMVSASELRAALAGKGMVT